MTVYLLQVHDHLRDLDALMSCPCGTGNHESCDNCPYPFCSVHGHLAHLLAMTNALLVLHQPKTVIVRTLCGAHDAHSLSTAEGRAAVNTCPDCTEHERIACAECDPICPDDNIYPCETVQLIVAKLVGKESGGQ
jgi:hypothetical protein